MKFMKLDRKKIGIFFTVIIGLIITSVVVINAIDDTPANPAFKDYNLYSCVIDAYKDLHIGPDSSINEPYAISEETTDADYESMTPKTTNLTDEQLQEITELSCNSKIDDISGIEKMTNLKYLSLAQQNADNENNLQNIDLTQFTKLTYLNLTNASLKTIDLKNNKDLETIILPRNQLTEIDLTGMTKLKYLNLGNNDIESLNLNGITTLEELNLEFNQTFESISNLEKQENLRYLNVRQTAIETLNLPKDSETKYAQLQELNVSELPNLTELDLRNNFLLVNLIANDSLNLNIKFKPEKSRLAFLRIENTNISNLDITGFESLKSISVEGNHLLSLTLKDNHQLQNTTFYACKGSHQNCWVESSSHLGYITSDPNFTTSLSTDDKPQTRTVQAVYNPETGKFEIKLQELDPNLKGYLVNFDSVAINDSSGTDNSDTTDPIIDNDTISENTDPSKEVLQGVQYDPYKGIITLDNTTNKRLTYTYKVMLSQGVDKTQFKTDFLPMKVVLTIKYSPVLDSIHIGSSSGTKYTTSANTKVWLSWHDENITHYCITTTNDSGTCVWKDAQDKNNVAIDYTLKGEDGNKNLYAFIKNSEGLVSNVREGSIILDTTKPRIENIHMGYVGNDYINDRNQHIRIDWNYDDKDVQYYCIKNTLGSDNCSWKPVNGGYSVGVDYTLSAGDGEKIVYVYLKDEAGNISDVGTIQKTLDTTKPEIKNFYIGGEENPESVSSADSSVYLSWEATDVDAYCISETKDSKNCSWESVEGTSVTDDYDLSVDGEITLYAFIVDKAGNVSEYKADSITVDANDPTIVSFYIGGKDNPDYATSTNSSIYLTWKDKDVKEYCITSTDDSGSCTSWQSTNDKNEISPSYVLQGANNEVITLYAFIKDKTNRISASKSDSITLKTEKPVIKSFKINNKVNGKYTLEPSIGLTLSWDSEGVTHYCITTQNSSSKCDWVPSNGKKEFTITQNLSDKDGQTTLYAFIMNEALVSDYATDSIILDRKSPTLTDVTVGSKDSTKTNSPQTDVYVSWDDNDVTQYCVNTTDNSENCTWKNLSDADKKDKDLLLDYTLPDGDGQKDVYVFVKDEAGHVSEVGHDSIIVDTKSPEITNFFIGGKDNPETTSSRETKLYLSYDDPDVTHYCISTSDSSSECEWKETKGKAMEIDYTLSEGTGQKVLYAFIKDDLGHISKVKSDTINIPKINNTDKPGNNPKTGGAAIGLGTIATLGAILVTYRIIKKKNKIAKL